MKNIVAKTVSSVTNQIKAIEGYETEKLNMSTSLRFFCEFGVILTILFKFSLYLVWHYLN